MGSSASPIRATGSRASKTAFPSGAWERENEKKHIRDGRHSLTGLPILLYENSLNLFIDRRDSIGEWRKYSAVTVTHSDRLVNIAEDLMRLGIKEYDALHAAAAITANAELFVTTDDRLAKKLKIHGKLLCALPQEAFAYLENGYEN